MPFCTQKFLQQNMAISKNLPLIWKPWEGLAATLVDRIVDYKMKEASHNGACAEEQRWKRKDTAEEWLWSQEKRISSGLLAAVGHFHLGAAVWDNVQHRANAAKEKEYNASIRKKDEYDVLFTKV